MPKKIVTVDIFFRAQGAELTAALHDLPAQLRLEPLRLGFWRRF